MCPKVKKPEHAKQKQYCEKFNKEFKNGPHLRNLPASAGDTGSIPSLGRLHMARSS